MIVAVVGASGWIGSHVVHAGNAAGIAVRGIGRSDSPPPGIEVAGWRRIPDEASVSDLASALSGVDAVINTAGRAHQPEDTGADFANEALPARLVEAASSVASRRVVHLSSIKAISEGGPRELTAHDVPKPSTSYGRSKMRGEQYARERAASSALDLVVVRVPVVHGVGAPGNLHRLESLVRRGLPVPLPAPYPVRSVADVFNVSSLLIHLATVGRTPPPVVHWSDTPHLNTRQLLDRLAERAGRRARVVRLPGRVARFVLSALGREADADRLLAPLIVQPSDLESYGWTPPYPRHSGFAGSEEHV